MSIKENARLILDSVPKDITVVAAVKYADKNQILESYAAGIRNFGFNTLKQAQEIMPCLPKDAKIHFIGTLQKNKVKKLIVLKPALIHSVDTKDLAEKINSEAKKAGLIQNILIQVNTDPQKESGILEEHLGSLIDELTQMKNIRILGLMTIPPASEDPEQSRPYFRAMRALLKNQKSNTTRPKKISVLSMGMSSDYRIAIEEGATIIRPGRCIFS